MSQSASDFVGIRWTNADTGTPIIELTPDDFYRLSVMAREAGEDDIAHKLDLVCAWCLGEQRLRATRVRPRG